MKTPDKSHKTQEKNWRGRLQWIKKIIIISNFLTLPHSAQTCTRGPCVCKCFRIAELSRNILVQPCKSKETQNVIQYNDISKTAKRTQTGYQSIVIKFSCLEIHPMNIWVITRKWTENWLITDKFHSIFNKAQCWKLNFDSTRCLEESLSKCTCPEHR